jgi:hypothetical protein
MELIELDNSKRSECSFHRINECGVCSDGELIKYYKQLLGSDKQFDETPQSLIQVVKDKLGVRYESEIFMHTSVVNNLGRKVCRKILKKYFKAQGPRHSTALLNNNNIDETLESWSVNADKLFSRKFKHIEFQMIDFYDTYGALNSLDLNNLANEGYDSVACVLNTDVSSGEGKHWFCIFCDIKNKDKDKYLIELFNSSGNPPVQQITDWIKRLNSKHPCIIRKALSRRLQESRTECGVWCLAYIYWRLRGCDNTKFEKYMTDGKMIELRNFLFR